MVDKLLEHYDFSAKTISMITFTENRHSNIIMVLIYVVYFYFIF